MKKILILAILAAMLLPAASHAGPSAASGQPDVLVLVQALPRGNNEVCITYPTIVPKTQVQHDMDSLHSISGWVIKNPKITAGLAPIRGSKDVMTTVVFNTNNVVAPDSHAFPIEPIVTALRGYNHILITYFLNSPIHYTGLRDYDDNNVSVSFEERGPAYTYHVKLHNTNFQKLNLPLYQPAPSTVRTASKSVEGRHAVKPWQVALIAVLAAVAGGAVYMAMAKHS